MPLKRLQSNYAFHNLGGIDRSVYLVALPDVNVRSLLLRPTLDHAYQDGRLDLTVGLENTRAHAVADVRLRLLLIESGDAGARVAGTQSAGSASNRARRRGRSV